MANGITKDQARKELAKRELARRQQPTEAQIQAPGGAVPDIIAQAAGKATGIQNVPPLRERISGGVAAKAPVVGQTAGGILGSILGGRVGAPIRGSAVGGTAGRAVGIGLQKLIQGGPITNAEKKNIGKELLATAGTEAILAPVSALTIGAGKGALEALLGPRVAERGFKEGFKRFLDPKFYQDRVPKTIVDKTSKFFDKLNRVTGKGVEKSVMSKTNIFHNTSNIKQAAHNALVLRGATSIDDLGSAGVSKAQLNKVKKAKEIIDNLGGKEKNILGNITRKEFNENFLFSGQGPTHPLLKTETVTGGVTKKLATAKAFAGQRGIERTEPGGIIKIIRKSDISEAALEELETSLSGNISSMGLQPVRAITSIPANVKDPFSFLLKKGIIGTGEVNTPTLWKARREIDKIRFRNKFDPDIKGYLDDLRNSLNAPLKNSGDDVAQSFGRYSSVKEMEKQLENKFEATLIDGEIFSPQTEQFANTLLGTSKDETVRGIRKLDSFLGAEDRIIEDLLDVAATESLSKTINFMGVIQRSLIGALGGQRGIARGAAAIQSPVGQTLRTLINRGLAAGGTEAAKGLQGEQQP